MGLKQLLKKLDKADRTIDRVIDRMFVLFAAIFGAWVAWAVFEDASVSLVLRIGISLMAALICAALMWLFWTLAKFLL